MESDILKDLMSDASDQEMQEETESKHENDEELEKEEEAKRVEEEAAFMDRLRAAKSIHSLAHVLHSKELQTMLHFIQTDASSLPSDAVIQANQLVSQIEQDIITAHRFLQQIYASRFPELASLVTTPLEYARTVQIIGNQQELTKITWPDSLSHATQMVLTVAASSTLGQPLKESSLKSCQESCQMLIELDQARNQLIEFVSTRMAHWAPNVTALLGASLAARILGAVGGLSALAKLPAANLQVVGQQQMNTTSSTALGLAHRVQTRHQGLIALCDLVTSCPLRYRRVAVRLISCKTVLAARLDAEQERNRQASNSVPGEWGQSYRQDIVHKLEKLMAPSQMKNVKALPVPILQSKKKRGGRRARARAQLVAATALRQRQNRLVFGEAEEELVVGDQMISLGQPGASTGHIRSTSASDELEKRQRNALKQKSVKKYAHLMDLGTRLESTNETARSLLSGTQTSLTLTAQQGMVLATPMETTKVPVKKKSWFS